MAFLPQGLAWRSYLDWHKPVEVSDPTCYSGERYQQAFSRSLMLRAAGTSSHDGRVEANTKAVSAAGFHYMLFE